VTAQFADLSQFQPSNIDWQAYKQWSARGDGISRVALRSSYGVGYVDTHFQTYREDALSAGIDMIIMYHYAYPQYNNATDEANWQRQVVGAMRPQDIVILDFEENVPQATAEWAVMWLQFAQGIYAKMPGIYASTYYIQQRLQDQRLAPYPLWLANWQFTPDERPPVPWPWQSYEFVQYSDRETSIPGIAGTVDANIFLGIKPQQQEEEQPTMINLDTPRVGDYFEGNDDAWKCKRNGFVISGAGAVLFYRQFGGSGLCGLTHLGLPVSGSFGLADKPGVVYQRFERGVLVFDEGRHADSPPGAVGQFYVGHIDQGPFQDPRIAPLQDQINHLLSENAALQKQLESGQTIPQPVMDDIKVLVGNAQKLATDAGV
jgi:GH25 family lysozyme M1 (1,4-beta-N-acetylmuramidase)